MKLNRIKKGLKVEAGIDGRRTYGAGLVLGFYGEPEIMALTPDTEKGDILKDDVFVLWDNKMKSWIAAKALRPQGTSKQFYTP